jgi:iron(III) transport system substrate-binding protein
VHPVRSIVAITAVACLGLPGVALGQLNLVCSVPAEWCKIIADEFQKDTGIKVVVLTSGGGEALAMLVEQARNPRADVWFGGPVQTHLRSTKFNLLQEYASPMASQLQPWAQKVAEQSKSQSIGVYARVLGIGYNAALATQKKLAAPACWKDLIKPGFAGDVHITDPNASAASYMAIATMAEIFGEDEAFKYLKAMYKAPPPAEKGRAAAEAKGFMPQGTALPGRGKDGAGKGGAGKADAGNAVAKGPPPVGNAMAGIGFVGDIVAEAEGGAPVKAVAPCEGTIYDVGAVSIVNGAKNLDNAKKFVDWALGAKAQALPAQAKQYAYPANTGVTASPLAPKFGEAKLITYDAAKYEKSPARRRLLDRWAQEVGASAP